MGTNFFDIKTLNTRSFTTSNTEICRKKIKNFLEDQPKIAIFLETNQSNSGVQILLKTFRFELGAYKVLLHQNPVNQQRSMLIMIHRSCPLTLTGTENIDNNCVKLKMIRNEMLWSHNEILLIMGFCNDSTVGSAGNAVCPTQNGKCPL